MTLLAAIHEYADSKTGWLAYMCSDNKIMSIPLMLRHRVLLNIGQGSSKAQHAQHAQPTSLTSMRMACADTEAVHSIIEDAVTCFL